MAELREQVLDLLEEVCENDIVKENPDVLLFEEGVLDSFGTVSLLVEIQERLGIEVSISDFDRDEWATPNMIVKKLAEMK
ncbi:D-alanine--poly(phosphoribitol) ligase subunit DltC [Ectobacillus panaciterrae]|uniref:D-alanine--poly(phosphoribitol) ligase subunit DltC n=1 Tax=Ectobacillus panaciterrae TaxID=363872 RepID=UPI0003FAF20B|nr:D-alanine--poly(phosphoribitol) ligase subunit DltC [Ectobacillus panaciterrae]